MAIERKMFIQQATRSYFSEFIDNLCSKNSHELVYRYQEAFDTDSAHPPQLRTVVCGYFTLL
jgi:hypothetical protein